MNISSCTVYQNLYISMYMYICSHTVSSLHAPASFHFADPAQHKWGTRQEIQKPGHCIVPAMGKAKRRAASSSAASGSGHSPSPSESISPRSRQERVGKYDISHISKIWDDTALVRERVREKHNLVQNFDIQHETAVDAEVEKTPESCRLNSLILMPILDLMRENNLMPPSVDRLIEVIDKFYKISKVSRDLEHCYHQAWAVRDLINVLKGFIYRDAPPTETLLKK